MQEFQNFAKIIFHHWRAAYQVPTLDILTEWLYLAQEIVVNDHILDNNRLVELLVWFAVSTLLDFDFFSIWFFFVHQFNTWPLFWFILRFFIVFMVFTVEEFFLEFDWKSNFWLS